MLRFRMGAHSTAYQFFWAAAPAPLVPSALRQLCDQHATLGDERYMGAPQKLNDK